MSPAAFFKTRTGRRLRLVFRWMRITLWFLIFLVVAAGAYLHLIGLPDFLKQDLLGHLRERGFEVQFTSARLGWGPDVIVDNAAFHRSDRPLGPRLAAGQTVIHLNLDKLLHRRVSVDALLISEGSLQLPFSEARGDFLSVNNVSLDLALLPNDTIRLKDGHASFHGIQMALRGTVTNFLAARDLNLWPGAARTNQIPAPPGPASAQTPARTPQDSLRQIAATLNKIHFPAPPRLDLNLTADGRDPDTLRMEFNLESDGVQTPWGEAAGLKLAANCARPIHSGSNAFVNARLSAAAFTTPRAGGTNLYLTIDVSHGSGSNLQAAVNFSVTDLAGRPPGLAATSPLTAASLHWDGNVTLQPSPFALLAVSGIWRSVRVATPWGSADAATVTGIANAAGGFPAADDSWGFWAKINRWTFDWQASLDKLVTPKIQLNGFVCAGSWRAPELVLTNLDAALYRGGLSGRVRLDVATHELAAGVRFDFEEHDLSPLLPAPAQSWLGDISWERPPRIALEARVLLPSWTNRPPDWAAQLLPSLQLAGDFSTGAVSYRGLAVDSAQSHFTCSNQVWNLPRLHLVRSDGDLSANFTGGAATPGFLLVLDTKMNPGAIRPLLPEPQQPLLDEAVFSETDPPVIHAEIRGRWHEPEKLAVHARLTATNFTARGEKVDGLASTMEYSNFVARLADLRVFKDGGELDAPFAELDWAAKKISFSNVVSTLDKNIAVRLLEPHAPEWLKVIGFDTPPTVHASGSFVLDDSMATDVHFAVSGRNFRYTKLLAETASGEVHWAGQNVALTNVQAGFYDGTLHGWGVFDYAPKMGTQFRGRVSLAKIELPLLVQAWSAKSNHVEGVLYGNIAITGGSSTNKHSWTGFGRLSVNQALLWNIRLFGFFSPILNKIIPGAGNSRAYQASADFIITNAMIATDNLEIRSTDFRLLYRGTLNTEKQLDARVEAKLLRDTPVFGRFFSWALTPLDKLFEYKIGGTLDAPTHHALFPKSLGSILEPSEKESPSSGDQPPAPAKPPP